MNKSINIIIKYRTLLCLNYFAEMNLILVQDVEGLLVAVELVLVYQAVVRVQSVPS
jgi:hypothetical protein